MSKQKELVKNTIIIFLGKFSTQFISFLLLPLYTHFLSTDDYGSVDLIITYISLFVPIIALQQEMAVFRYLIDCRKNEKEKKKIITTVLSTVFSLTIAFSLLFFLVTIIWNIKYKYLILMNIIICIFSGIFLQISRGLGKNINYSIASFISGIIAVVSNFLLIAVCKIGAEAILISMSLANISCIIYLFISLKLNRYIEKGKKDSILQKELIQYSLPLIPNGISWWIINASDRTIISIFLGVGANGIYAISNKFSSIVSAVLSIFNMSWTESASLYINDKDRDSYFSDIVNTTMKLVACLCLGIISCMPFIFPILISIDFKEAYQYIPIFMIGAMCNCIVSTYSAIYIAKKLTRQVAVTSFLSALINIIFNILFIKYIGLYAAAISTAIAYLSMAIYRHYDLKKYVNITYQMKNLFAIIIMFIFTILCYYQNNIIYNMISLIVTIIATLIINKELIIKITKKMKVIKNKGV